MTHEPVTLCARDGRSHAGSAEVARQNLGARAVRAGAIAIGSVLLGAATIVIPAAHLVLPWFIPLVGFGVAAYVFSVRARVGAVRGACPSCEQPMVVEGGPLEDPLWVRCPACQAPAKVVFSPG